MILDTNVVLDWLLFANPVMASLVAAMHAGQVRWLATSAMRQELSTVLSRGLAQRHGADASSLLRVWDRHAELHPQAPSHPRLRCSDGDDQQFIDLAMHSGARWLLSRDRALLKLARRAGPSGLTIATPERWQPPPS